LALLPIALQNRHNRAKAEGRTSRTHVASTDDLLFVTTDSFPDARAGEADSGPPASNSNTFFPDEASST
jgi:hypothetical protein